MNQDNQQPKQDGALKKLIKKAIAALKRRLIMLMIPVLLVIVAAALVAGIFELAAEAVKNAVASIGSSSETSSETSSEVSVIVDETDGSIEITNETLDTILESLYEADINPEDIGLLSDIEINMTEEEYQEALRKYLREFYEAQVTTETLNYQHKETTDDVTYGAVYLYRATGESATEERTELTYIPYEEMLALEAAGDESAKNYFSLDEEDNLVIAGTTQVIVETGTSEGSASGANLSKQSDTMTVILKSIDYKSLISQYTTQIAYLIDLLLISQNPEFVVAVADLIKDSRIEITITDTVSTNVFTETFSYIPCARIEQTIHRESQEITYYETIRGNKKYEITKTTTKTTTPIVHVTYAKTWFSEQEITYDKKIEGPDVSPPVVTPLGSETPPSGEGSWRENKELETQNSVTTDKYEEAVRGDVVFKVGEAGDGKRYEDGQIEEPTFVGLMETLFKVPNSERHEEAGTNLMSGADLLIYLLQQDDSLQSMEIITRYALYKYSEDTQSFGVTELSSDIFAITELNQVVAGTDIGKEFTKSWENNALRKYMNGESSYMGKYVVDYITEDNTKFICYTDVNNTRNYGFGICHYTGGRAGGTSNNHISKYASLGIDIKAAEYNQVDVSELDVDIVMTIFNQVYDEYRAEVLDRKEKYAPNAPDLTEQQIICLTDMRYQGSIKWKDFYAIYATQNTEQIKNYIIEHSGEGRGEARWKAYSEGVFITRDNEILDPNDFISGDGILGVARQVWLEVCNRFTSYGGLGSIPPSESKTQIDCSGYVSWVLYEYGYTDFNHQVNSAGFLNTDWGKKYGWLEINVKSREDATNLLKPGDIFVRYGEGTHHVLIVERIENGRLYAYDCGSAKNWLNSGGNSVHKSYFLDEAGEGKIIRIEYQGRRVNAT